MATGSSCSTSSRMPADHNIGDLIPSATSQRPVESVSNTTPPSAGSSDNKGQADDDDVRCAVCERFNHAAMFNIFKCFCLAQRLFLVAKLFQFRVCHVKSSYLCEHCLERLEVIEELELLKKEFVCNFIGRCKVEESLHIAASKDSNVPTVGINGQRVHKLGATTSIEESEQNSIICTPKRAQEPELMAISRLKRQMQLVPEDNSVGKWRVDVLTTPNDLGGINHMNLAALPTIRKLFTANGQRRYWLLPPTSTDMAPVRNKKRRFSELVQYLKQQTASNALLASVRNSAGCVKVKRRDTSTTTEETGVGLSSIKETSTSDSCAATTKDLTNGDVTEPVESAKNVAPAQASTSRPDDQAEPSTASPMSDQRVASSDDEDDDDDVMIIDEDHKSFTTTTPPTRKIVQLSENNRDVELLFGMIENVVDSFLHFDEAERLAMVKSSEANMLDRVMEPELEPATLPAAPVRPKPRNSPAVNHRLKTGLVSVDAAGRPSATLKPLLLKPGAANTTRVAPTIRLVAVKNALAASTSTASASSSANVSQREISIPIISSAKTVCNTSTMTGSTTGIVVYTPGRSSSSFQGQQVIIPPVVTNAGTPPAPQQLTLVTSNSKQPLVIVGIRQGAVAYVSQSMVTTESQFQSTIDGQSALK